MNRRDFTKSLAALGLTPALPSLPVAARTAAGYSPYMYGLGAHLARSQGTVSVAMLMQKLRLAPEAAQAMQAQLLRQGIVTAPNAAGLATAAQPYMRGVTAGSTTLSVIGEKAKSATRDWVRSQLDDPDERNEEMTD